MLRTTTEPHLDVQCMIHIHLSPPPPLWLNCLSQAHRHCDMIYYWFFFREKLEGSQRLQFSSRSLPGSNYGHTSLYSSAFRILLIRTFNGGIIHNNKPFQQTVTWFLYVSLITCEDQKGWIMAKFFFWTNLKLCSLWKIKKEKIEDNIQPSQAEKIVQKTILLYTPSGSQSGYWIHLNIIQL